MVLSHCLSNWDLCRCLCPAQLKPWSWLVEERTMTKVVNAREKKVLSALEVWIGKERERERERESERIDHKTLLWQFECSAWLSLLKPWSQFTYTPMHLYSHGSNILAFSNPCPYRHMNMTRVLIFETESCSHEFPAHAWEEWRWSHFILGLWLARNHMLFCFMSVERL